MNSNSQPDYNSKQQFIREAKGGDKNNVQMRLERDK